MDKNKISPSVVKIDVEGGEAKVFKGGLEELRKTAVILLEFHEAELHKLGSDPAAFFQSLFDLDKRVFLLDKKNGNNTIHYREIKQKDTIEGNVHLALLHPSSEIISNILKKD